jgi:hypothetical protein
LGLGILFLLHFLFCQCFINFLGLIINYRPLDGMPTQPQDGGTNSQQITMLAPGSEEEGGGRR